MTPSNKGSFDNDTSQENVIVEGKFVESVYI